MVLDCFCGGSVTIFEAVAQNRKAIGVDINPLATFITKMQMFDGDIDDLTQTYNDFIQSIKEKYGDWYRIELADDSGIYEWVEWAYVVSCPLCQAEIELIDRNKVRNGIYRCLSKECQEIQGVRRADCIPKGTVPVRARYKSNKTNTLIEIELEKGSYNIVCGVDYEKWNEK